MLLLNQGAGGFVINGRVNGRLMVTRAFGDYDYKSRTATDSTYEGLSVKEQIAAANAAVAALGSKAAEGVGAMEPPLEMLVYPPTQDPEGVGARRGTGEPKLSLGGEMFGDTTSSADGEALSTTFFEISDDSADDGDDSADGDELSDGLSGTVGGSKSHAAVHGVSDEYTCGPVIAEPELQVRPQPHISWCSYMRRSHPFPSPSPPPS
jgi:hypothetical protein